MPVDPSTPGIMLTITMKRVYNHGCTTGETLTTVVEQYDTPLEHSDRTDSGLRNRKVSMEALHNGNQEDYGLEEFGDLSGASICRRLSVEKNMDEMSAVSWDEN
eukprot:scaffold375419_cov79-Cyclotella_meneghiniana.AAC.1